MSSQIIASISVAIAGVMAAAQIASAAVPTGDRGGCQLIQRTTDGPVCLDL